MSSKPQNVTQVQSIDPMLQPYVKQGLDEAARLYGQQPNYFPGQTYVGASDPTQAALLAQRNRAMQGNTLNPAAQRQQLNTNSSDNLADNPYIFKTVKVATK